MKDNKLIAEFMGVNDEISLDSIAGNIHSWSDAPFFYITEDSKEKVMEGIAKYSKYHTSWDWLMPVVEKCLEKHNNLIDGRDVIDTSYSSIAQALQVVSIKETYKAVVEFIKDQVCHVELQEWEKNNQ